jgi:hypothetical protein
LIRILKKKVRRNKFRSGKVGAIQISWKCHKKDADYYNQRNLCTFESFLHVENPRLL